MAVIRRGNIPGVTLGLAGLLAAVIAWPHANEQQPNYVLQENVHWVIVPVTAKDSRGDVVDDLKREDFHVFEDGQERPVQYFSNESPPLSAVVLLDTGMTGQSLAVVREAARSLGSLFGPEDEEALFLFDNTIRLAQDFTSQAELLRDVAVKVIPEGAGPALAGGPLAGPTRINGVPIDRPGTVTIPARQIGKRLVDALYTAAHRLKTRPVGRRRLVLVISDGVNGSDNLFSFQETKDALAASDIAVYAVSFGSGWAVKREDRLARLARETGGDIAYAQRRAALNNALLSLTNEARNSYILGFSPASADGKFHEIHVRVARPGLRLIARDRFLSVPKK